MKAVISFISIRPRIILAAFLLLLTVPLNQSPIQAASGKPDGAEQYYRATVKILDGVDKEMPSISKSADAAAELYVNGDGQANDYGIGADGDEAFYPEATGRAGGIMKMQGWISPNPKVKSDLILLFCLNDRPVDAQYQRIRDWQASGAKVVLFGRKDQLDKVSKTDIKPWARVEIPGPWNDGLFYESGGPNTDLQPRWLVPTHFMGEFATEWVWMGEFVAACTRRGKMPPMYQSVMAPTARDRMKQYANVKFHDADLTPPPIPAGRIGHEYLRITKQYLSAMEKTQSDRIEAAADACVAAYRGGAHLYTLSEGHAVGLALRDKEHEPGWFTPIADLHKLPAFTAADVLFGAMYYTPGTGATYGSTGEEAAKAGANRVWAMAGFDKEAVASLAPTDIWINTQWEYGDAVVTLPKYDIKVLPASGILTVAAYEMVNAQMYTILQSTPQPPVTSPPAP